VMKNVKDHLFKNLFFANLAPISKAFWQS